MFANYTQALTDLLYTKHLAQGNTCIYSWYSVVHLNQISKSMRNIWIKRKFEYYRDPYKPLYWDPAMLIVSYLKEDCNDLHVIYVLYLYKYVYLCMLKLAAIFLIKRNDQFKFMY